MSGDAASTTRKKETGKICCVCKSLLGPPPPDYRPGYPTGERHCDKCGPTYDVLMRFDRYFEQWFVVLEAEGRIVRKITMSAPRLLWLAMRGGGLETVEAWKNAVQAMMGKGGALRLHLKVSQYETLKYGRRKEEPPVFPVI